VGPVDGAKRSGLARAADEFQRCLDPPPGARLLVIAARSNLSAFFAAVAIAFGPCVS
jgi:hypothetical protein